MLTGALQPWAANVLLKKSLIARHTVSRRRKKGLSCFEVSVIHCCKPENNLTREKVMEITKKTITLIDEWVELHQEIEKLENELETLSLKLKKINTRLFAKNPKEELEQFRDSLGAEIKKLDKKGDKNRIRQLSHLKAIVEHDINIDNLVEQDIDIEEKGIDIDLKDYKTT